jgi:putative transcriptional regulator
MKLTPIRLRRLNLDFKSEYVIESLDISKSTFYKLEQGWATPSPKLIKRIAEIYGCTTDEIFRDLKITGKNQRLISQKK